MSVALTQAVESLHITVARKLQELIESERDSGLLSKLLAIAVRLKVPKPPAPPKAAPPDPSISASNRATHAAASPTASKSANPNHPQPPLPYSDDEYGALVLRYGEDEAAHMNIRREDLIAEFARTHPHANPANPANSS